MNRSPIRMPNLTWRQRGAFALGVAIVGAVGAYGMPAADAHDFSIQVGKPACVDGTEVKRVTVTVTNPWDDSAKVFTANMSGGFAPIAAHGTFSFIDTAPGAKVGMGVVTTVMLRWDADGFTKTRTYQVNWGDEPCQNTPATTTTLPICPEGQHYSNVPPIVGCTDDAPTTTTIEPPATNAPEPTTTTNVTDQLPPVSIDAPTTTPTVAPKFSPPRTAPKALPATGSSSTVVIIAGVAALMVGGALLLAGRKGEA